MLEYKVGVGKHIDQVAREMIALAGTTGSVVSSSFNGISLQAKPGQKVKSITKYFTFRDNERREAYKKSPEYAEAQEMAAIQVQEKEAQLLESMEQLVVVDFNNLRDVIDWLVGVQDATDHIGIQVPVKQIINTFKEHGLEANVNCGDDFIADDEENHARWLIGQALDGLQSVGAIHPMVHSFAKEWKSQFGQESPT